MQTKNIFLIILSLVTYLTFTTPVKAQAPNSYPECPPNRETILIIRNRYGVPPGEFYEIPFESGTYTDTNEGELNNYLAGVLQGEMGPTRESPDWHEEAAKAISIAARTAAYYSCDTFLVYDPDGNSHRGVTDISPQHYQPNHAAAYAEEYRTFVEQTTGQHLTYNDDFFGLQYRKYVGQETEEGKPPHKSVKDPVGSPNEVDKDVDQVGMGFHSAQHWAEGRHNQVGCEGEPEDDVGCDGTPASRWRSNLVWDDLRILAHYYSQVEFEGFATYIPTEYRWNMLTTSLDQRRILATETTIPVTVQIQNSSTQSYRTTSSTRRYELLVNWVNDDSKTGSPKEPPRDEGEGDTCPDIPEPEGMVRIGLPLAPGDAQTVTISLDTPSEPGSYILEWDMRRQEKLPKLGWCWMIFSQNRWPKQEQRFYLTLFSYQVYLPAITNQPSTQ